MTIITVHSLLVPGSFWDIDQPRWSKNASSLLWAQASWPSCTSVSAFVIRWHEPIGLLNITMFLIDKNRVLWWSAAEAIYSEEFSGKNIWKIPCNGERRVFICTPPLQLHVSLGFLTHKRYYFRDCITLSLYELAQLNPYFFFSFLLVCYVNSCIRQPRWLCILLKKNQSY